MALDPTLMAEIVAHPNDDAARLVLADKLSEAGDPRGEFIVVQCMLAARGLPPPRTLELRRRADALLQYHRRAWTANADGAERCVMRRGFVDEIEADAGALLPRAANLFANEPITRLTLRAAKGAVLALANANAFARVSSLTIRGSIGDDGARALAAALARREAPLERLNVDGCGIGSAGAKALAGALAGCRSLALTGNAIADEGVTALAKSKALAALLTLYVSDNQITDEGIEALAKGALASLTRLAVARNEVSADALQALAKSKKLKKLRWLEYTDPQHENQRIAVRSG
jgi:uncharacterized protein (TIGR02996 family)